MNIVAKFKETAYSVLPVMAIVLLLGIFVVPLEKSLLAHFCTGGFFLIAGLTVFLLGVDLGIQPMGERCGAALTNRRSLLLLLAAALAIGFVVTAAEPDIQVFGNQVNGVFPSVSKGGLVFSIAGGVGLFMAVGIARTALGLSIKWTLFISYTLLFLLALFAPPAFVAIAFDSGGATTGPMTVPFIMALGLGVSSVRADKDGGFGLTGVASVGPVLAVLAYAIAAPASQAAAGTAAEAVQTHAGGAVLREAFRESVTSILPLFALLVAFQILLLKMTRRQFIRIGIGFVYALIGLTVFLFGVNSGFMQAGRALGEALGANALGQGGPWYAVLLGTGLVFGAVIVCAEPAVWVLSEQVEQVSGGTIRRRALLVFLALGTAIAIGLAMLRAVCGFRIAWILVPGYALAMALLYFAPPLFTGIAFDSGGVASGPLTSTFILSFTLGAASGGAGGSDSFGVIALVAMMPLIAIQLMGIIYDRRMRANRRARAEGGGT
ncbi:MAG: DUF1538 domain-containing protein [Kiritimatiellae bacterium]|nr:DUF1538 domain-containing protein [Kiritimatiellia bacterium]